jgi:hypothetical protein
MDSTIKVWNPLTREEMITLNMGSPVTSLHINPIRPGVLSSTNYQGDLIIWNLSKSNRDFIYYE